LLRGLRQDGEEGELRGSYVKDAGGEERAEGFGIRGGEGRPVYVIRRRI